MVLDEDIVSAVITDDIDAVKAWLTAWAGRVAAASVVVVVVAATIRPAVAPRRCGRIVAAATANLCGVRVVAAAETCVVATNRHWSVAHDTHTQSAGVGVPALGVLWRAPVLEMPTNLLRSLRAFWRSSRMRSLSPSSSTNCFAFCRTACAITTKARRRKHTAASSQRADGTCAYHQCPCRRLRQTLRSRAGFGCG